MRQWLIEIRKSKKLSTYKFAEMCGISQSYYFAIEHGSRGRLLPVNLAKRIANALGFEWTRFYEN